MSLNVRVSTTDILLPCGFFLSLTSYISHLRTDYLMVVRSVMQGRGERFKSDVSGLCNNSKVLLVRDKCLSIMSNSGCGGFHEQQWIVSDIGQDSQPLPQQLVTFSLADTTLYEN